MKNEITWAANIPLIGGFPIGCEKAMGKPPVSVYSYDGFWDNDSHYMNYLNNTRGLNVEYNVITPDTPKTNIDVVVGTPPCAALSMLNTGQSTAVKGAECAKNDWMYRVFEDSIDLFNVKAVVIENAPRLFTVTGDAVANKLFDICRERGYSLSLYKTSTSYHGIPQNRDRCFAVGWKSETAPIMGWYKRPFTKLGEYLEEVPHDAVQHDVVINPKIEDEPYWNFLRTKTNEDIRDLIKNYGCVTTFHYVQRNGLLEEAAQWFEATGNVKGAKYARHAQKKFADGKGIWDGSIHVFGDTMNAVIGRNMMDSIHPKHDRSLTMREALHLMGFPHDFEVLGGRAKVNMIAQNVPTCTARDVCIEIKKFLNGELQFSDTNFLRQNNHNEKMWADPRGTVNASNLEDFFV